MGKLAIEDIPAATMTVLRRRAERAHQSVEDYVRDLLVEEAGRQTLSDILNDTGSHNPRPLPFDTPRHREEDRAGRPE